MTLRVSVCKRIVVEYYLAECHVVACYMAARMIMLN